MPHVDHGDGLGVVLHDERGGEVEQAYENDGRRHRHARGRRRQPARREREQQVDDHELDDPHGDPPDAVEGRVVGLRKDGERPQRARGDQDGREPILAPRQRREAHTDGGGDHQGAGHGGPHAVPGRCLGEGQDHRAGAQRGGRDRQDHDRPGRQAPLRSSLHGVTIRLRRWCRRGCRASRRGNRNIDVLTGWPEAGSALAASPTRAREPWHTRRIDPHPTARASPATVGVLIVDDQPPFLVAARRLIASTPGFESVGEATSGERAVTLAAALRPDLVLMDVRMPGLGGLGRGALHHDWRAARRPSSSSPPTRRTFRPPRRRGAARWP